MLQLVYISTARITPSEAELEAILMASRRNNKRGDVSGLLVAGGRRFLQALEGPDKAVLDTYARIQADPRHYALVLLGCGVVQERSFGSWEMAFERGRDPGIEGGLGETIAMLTAGMADKSLRAQFTGFGTLHAKAA